MTANSKKLQVDLDNAREKDQLEVMERIIEDGGCPFCQENFSKYNRQPILKMGKYWMVTTNQWPYKHTKHHFLLIHHDHIESISEMSSDAGAELIELTKWLIDEYQIPGGGLVTRFGDTNYSAGSVVHLHAQLIQPDLDDPEYMPTRVKIGKRAEQLNRD